MHGGGSWHEAFFSWARFCGGTGVWGGRKGNRLVHTHIVAHPFPSFNADGMHIKKTSPVVFELLARENASVMNAGENENINGKPTTATKHVNYNRRRVFPLNGRIVRTIWT